MYLIFYIFASWFKCFILRRPFSTLDYKESYLAYKNCKSRNKKGLWKVLSEVNHLCHYWRTFPDTYFIFCHFLTDYQGNEFLESFIPQGAYGRISRGAIESSDYKILINDKVLFHEIMTQYGLPVPEMLITYKNNHWFINNKLVQLEDIDKFLSNYNENSIFIKLSSEGAARGVFVMKKVDNQWTINNQKVTALDLEQKYGERGFFLERKLVQEPILSSFNPDTVNTIRVLTLNNGKEVKIVSAAVRFGRQGAYVDNMHAGGLAVSIDIKTGLMENYGGRRFDVNHYYEHPDSHLIFKDVAVPQWREIIDLVHHTLALLPQFRSVGFDIVTTSNGPLILEINTGAGMDLAQVGKKNGIANEFKEYFNLISHY